jgi:orotate phosphoribosyltransferase
MQPYQRAFLDFAMQHGVLQFGSFTLKSGRTSPYFFNAGLFNTGATLAKLGQFYAQTIEDSGIEYDLIFGPAYKGIPLSASAIIALATDFSRDIPYIFNRKEKKDHGEGGELVGAPLEGRVIIVDDVITAGTAIREVMALFKKYPAAKPAAVVVAIDRQERGQGKLSAIQEVERDFGIPVISVVNLEHVLAFAEKSPKLSEHAEAIRRYRDQYGIEGL